MLSHQKSLDQAESQSMDWPPGGASVVPEQVGKKQRQITIYITKSLNSILLLTFQCISSAVARSLSRFYLVQNPIITTGV